MSSSSLENKKKHALAEALWAHDNFNILFYEIVEKFGNNDDAFRNQSPLEQAIGIMKELKEVMRPDYIRDELAMTTDFIQGRAYESIDELYGCMEQLYVEMVKEFLVQLPNAIFKQIIESNAEDYKKTVKSALKLVCKMEQLEHLVPWSFPVGTTITHFIPDQLPNA